MYWSVTSNNIRAFMQGARQVPYIKVLDYHSLLQSMCSKQKIANRELNNYKIIISKMSSVINKINLDRSEF